MARKKFLIVAGGLFEVVFGGVSKAFAQGAAGQTPLSIPNPLSNQNSLTAVLGSITTFLISIAVPLTAIMALIGGFQMLTSAGDPEKYSKGKKTLLWAAIGFTVVLLASSVVGLIKSLLGAQ